MDKLGISVDSTFSLAHLIYQSLCFANDLYLVMYKMRGGLPS